MIKFLLSIFLIESAVLLLASTSTDAGTNTSAVIIAITSAITTIVVAIIGFKVAKLNSKVDKYHTEVNGKMGQLLEVSKKASKAEGVLEQKEKQAETDAKSS